MEPFEFVSPTRVLYGPGRRAEVGAILAELRLNRVLFVCGTRFREAPEFREIYDHASDRIAGTFNDIPEHSSIDTVGKGVEVARELKVDGFLAVGGGTAIDTAKAIALVVAEGGTIQDHCIRYEPPDILEYPVLPAPKLPIVALPTTGGSSAEVDGGGGVADYSTGNKAGFYDAQLFPKVAILDPELTVSMDPVTTAGTGLNALAHCIEAIFSNAKQPFSTAFALEAIRVMTKNLPICVHEPNNIEARGQQQIAVSMSGIAMINSIVGVQHAFGHVLGVYKGLPHGVANAIMLPHSVAFNAPCVPDELLRIGDAMGVQNLTPDDDGVQAVLDRIRSFCRDELDAPHRLRDWGVQKDELSKIAAIAQTDMTMYFNPRSISDASELVPVLEAAW